MGIEDFEGYHSRRLNMPDGGKIICFFYRNNQPRPSIDDSNRNVFRVDAEGNVMWQITRIDHADRDWEVLHANARKRGLPGCIEPFIGFVYLLPDGSRPSGDLVDEIEYEADRRIELANLGVGSQWYSLDVDTGVAIETTPENLRQRPW
jgi:hypothetical protein